MLLLRPSPIAYVSVFLLLTACGGSVANGGRGVDGGTGTDGDVSPGDDSGVDASRADGGCSSNPVVGAACFAGETLCVPNDTCCDGFEWECDVADKWEHVPVSCACDVDASRPDGSMTEVPTFHRPNDLQCATVPAAGNCGSFSTGEGPCSSDSDCTAGTNGRCDGSAFGAPGCSCQYDTCQTDTDCPTGQLCACHGSAPFENDGNTCVPGDCRVDSDCGPKGYCSPSPVSCGGISGYYCHTAKDACVNTSDCPGTFDMGGCEYSTDDQEWECMMGGVCG